MERQQSYYWSFQGSFELLDIALNSFVNSFFFYKFSFKNKVEKKNLFNSSFAALASQLGNM